MAVTHDYDSTFGVLKIQATGQFDAEGYRKAMIQITQGEHYPPTVPTIWDLRNFDFASFDSQLAYNVQHIFSLFESRKGATIAHVVSTGLGYGIMRMLQVLLGIEEDSLVSFDYDQAEEWIRERTLARHPARNLSNPTV